MISQNVKEVKASASSKVLISGAYLIIDPKNEGVVLSTDARFESIVKSSKTALDESIIKVKSPQFALSLIYKIVRVS